MTVQAPNGIFLRYQYRGLKSGLFFNFLERFGQEAEKFLYAVTETLGMKTNAEILVNGINLESKR